MGGAEYQVKCIIDVLKDIGKYEIYFLTRHVSSGYRPKGYEIIKINTLLIKKRGCFFADTNALLNLFDKIKPDIIYQRSGTGYTGICAYYSKKTDCKFVWHIAHDKDVSPFKVSYTRDVFFKYIDAKFLEYGIRNSACIVAQTNDQVKILRENYRRSVSAVIHNFHPLPTETIEKDKPITIVWVANLKPIKRPEIFLKLSEDLKGMPGVRFVMIGGSQGKPEWMKLFNRKLEESKNVQYLGILDQIEVNEVLAKSHILVNASEAEGFSNTFIQAWMRKVPVVSLTVNPDNILSKEGVGMCSGNYGQMCVDVKELIENSELREAMGEKAQAYAFANYSEKEADKLLTLFEE